MAARLFLLLSVAIILYLALYPFNWVSERHPFDLSFPWGPEHHSLPDLVSNFFFFVPLGVFFSWSFSGWFRLLGGLLAAASLSLLVEVLQQYLPGRVPSLTDLMMNFAGAGFGIIVGPKLLKLPWGKTKSLDLTAFLLAIYFLYEPFFFTFDWGEIKQNLKALSLGLNPQNIFLPSVFLGFALRRVSLPWAIGLILGLEFGRVFLATVSLNLAKIAARFALSFSCYFLFQTRPSLIRSFLAVAYLIEGLYPYHFQLPSSLKLENFIPFKLYLLNFSLEAFFNLWREILIFFFWGLSGGSLKGALLLSGVREGLQLFIPERFFDPTSLFLASLGVLSAQKIFRRKDAV